MKKLLIPFFLMLLLITSATAYETNYFIENDGTIDLSSSPNPKGYSADIDNTHHYILDGSSTLFEYLYNDFSFVQTVGASSGLSYVGTIYSEDRARDEFLFRASTTEVRLMYDTGANLGNMALYNLNDYTPANNTLIDIKDIELSFNESSNDYTLIVYDYNKTTVTSYRVEVNAGVPYLNFSHLYEVDVTGLNLGLTLHGYIYNGTYFLFDEENYSIYRLSTTGDIIQKILVPQTQDTLKDFFVWNETAYIIDKNDDLARSYNFTLTQPPPVYYGVTYNNTGTCVEDQYGYEYLCNQTLFNVNLFTETVTPYCDEGIELQPCGLGCENVITDGFSNGVCETLTCTDECAQLNTNYCTTENTYSTCQIGASGCLELTYDQYCPINNYCFEGQCDNISINKSGLWTQDGIIVNIRVNSTNAYEEHETTIERATDIATVPTTTILGQGVGLITKYIYKTLFKSLATQVRATYVTPSPSSTVYEAVSCDFTNNLLEEDTFIHNNLASYRWNTNGTIKTTDGYFYYLEVNNTQAIKTLIGSDLSQEIELMLKPVETGYTTIQIKDGEHELTTLYIDYNKTAKNIIIGETNYDKVFVNETSLQPTDDLERIVLVSRHMRELNSNHYEILVIRKPLSDDIVSRSFSLPIQYTSSLADTPDTINITTNSDIQIYQILQREQDGFVSYTTVDTQQPTTACNYAFTGCKNVRVWSNIAGLPTYHFYEDVEVCAGQLGVQTDFTLEAEAEGIDNGTTTFLGTEIKNFGLKTAIVILSLILGFTFFLMGEMDNTSQRNATLIFGGLLFGLSLFYFVTAGIIPAWIVALFIIIAGGLVVLLMRRI